MHRRPWIAVFALLTAPACGAAADAPTTEEPVAVSFEPIIGGTPATNYPEAAILNIDVPSAGGTFWACSATVIAPRVILTAGHCVDGHSKWEVYVGSQYRLSTSATTYDWHNPGSEVVNPAQHDIGLVFLATDLVLPSYPTLATAPAKGGASVVNVGRIENGMFTNSLYEAAGAVEDGALSGYPFDYGAKDLIQPGDSGGPDFLAGTHMIVAVNSGAGSGTEVLARVDLVATWIQTQIAAHSTAAAPPADAGARAPVPSEIADAGAPSTPASEREPNDALAQANAFAGAAMTGALASTKDVDWFVLPVPVGTTAVALTATGDARLSAGVMSGSSCPLAPTTATALRIQTAGRPASLCLRVASPTRKVQSYRIAVAH